MIFEKFRPNAALLNALIIRPLLVLCTAKKDEQEYKEGYRLVTVTPCCLLLSKIIDGSIKITVHDELNTSFSFHGELFRKITVHGF